MSTRLNEANDELANFLEQWRARHALCAADVIEMLAELTRLEASRMERADAFKPNRTEDYSKRVMQARDHANHVVSFIAEQNSGRIAQIPGCVVGDIRKPVRVCPCGRVFRADELSVCTEGPKDRHHTVTTTLVGYEPFTRENKS